MSSRVAVLGVLVAFATACDPPSPKIRLFFSQGPAQDCGTDDCGEIPVLCGFYAGIRIVDPSEPSAPLYTRCQPLAPPMGPQRTGTACMLNQIQLEGLGQLPYRDLEFQVGMFPTVMVNFDNPQLPVCPSDSMYDVTTGFPVVSDVTPGPAIGGSAFYHPGDEAIDITMGCADTDELAFACSGTGQVQARATVDDFDTHVSVGTLPGVRCEPQAPANCLAVGIGEPDFADPDFVLTPSGQTTLDRVIPDPGSPAWSGSVDHLFSNKACITVNEITAESTTTITCTDQEDNMTPINTTTDDLRLVGVRLSKDSLDKILTAVSFASPPPMGITIGIVLDRGSPIAGQTVTAELPAGDTSGATPTILYLNSTRTAPAGTTTSSGPNGAVFVSVDAPFGTVFRSQKTPITARQIGGRIKDKVSIVVLDVGITNTGTTN